MSDDLLLSLLWFLPLAGAVLVLLLPKRAEAAIKGFALASRWSRSLLTLVAFAAYVAPELARLGPAGRAGRRTTS